MRILHVIPYFYPAWAYGGPPRAVFEIARRQVKAGHQVTVLTTDAFEKNKTLPVGNHKVKGIEIIRIKNLSNFFMWHFHFSTISNIKTNFGNKDFDVVHFHETRTLLNFQVIKLLTGKEKLIFSPWGTLSYNNSLILAKKIFDRIFLNKFKENIDISLGQNDHEVKILKYFNIGKDIKLFPLGIDSNFFTSLPSKKSARTKFGLNINDYILLFLGRFAKTKGLGLLIESFYIFAKLKKNAKLLLVGRDDGYLKKMYVLIKQYHLEEKIIVHEALYGQDRLKAYCSADVFVFTPVVYEETSTACLEALACNLPVITTNKATIPYFNKTDGVLETKDTKKDVMNALETLYYSQKEIKINRKKLKEYFDWNNLASNLKKIYQKTS